MPHMHWVARRPGIFFVFVGATRGKVRKGIKVCLATTIGQDAGVVNEPHADARSFPCSLFSFSLSWAPLLPLRREPEG